MTIENISLLADRDGRKVLRTFRGTWIVGMQLQHGYKVVGVPCEEAKVDSMSDLAVIRAESGKFVVHREFFKGPITIQVFDSFDDMAKEVPATIARRVARMCGLEQFPEEEYPVEPLDV